jgi:hypothetical protein
MELEVILIVMQVVCENARTLFSLVDYIRIIAAFPLKR